jgi:glycosyltransferase involved in cell wall biosynthesis
VRIIFTPEAFNQAFGGISRIFAELATGLRERGHSPAIAAGLYINEYIRDVPNVWGRHTPRVPRVARAAFNTAFARLAVSAARSAVVHQTYYSRHHYSSRHPLVITVFDMIHELFPELLASSGTVEKTIANKAYCCARADHICAISHQTKQDLVTMLGVPESKVSVTWLGNALQDVVPASIGRDELRPYLLYVGGRRWYKNFPTLLRAFAASDFLRSHYVIVCFGGGIFWDDELALINELQLQDHVLLRGGTDELLAGYYTHASAHVAVSLYEGFGLTLVEAMSTGCPVLCSRRGSFPEIAGDAAAYFDPSDSEDVRRVLEATLCNSQALAVLRQEGVRRAQEFSWSRCVAETADVYHKVLR